MSKKVTPLEKITNDLEAYKSSSSTKDIDINQKLKESEMQYESLIIQKSKIEKANKEISIDQNKSKEDIKKAMDINQESIKKIQLSLDKAKTVKEYYSILKIISLLK